MLRNAARLVVNGVQEVFWCCVARRGNAAICVCEWHVAADDTDVLLQVPIMHAVCLQRQKSSSSRARYARNASAAWQPCADLYNHGIHRCSCAAVALFAV